MQLNIRDLKRDLSDRRELSVNIVVSTIKLMISIFIPPLLNLVWDGLPTMQLRKLEIGT